MADDHIDSFRRGVEAFNTGDLDAAVALVHPDVEFVPLRAALQGSYHGHEGLAEFFADNRESFDLFEASYSEIRSLGDRVLAFGAIRARGKGSSVETQVVSAVLAEFREGKVTRFQDFGDRRAALGAAGLRD